MYKTERYYKRTSVTDSSYDRRNFLSLFNDSAVSNEKGTDRYYEDMSYPRYKTKQIASATTDRALSDKVKRHVKEIDMMLKEAGITYSNINEHYTEFQIPKSSGGYRTIEAPTEELKAIQRYMANFMLNTLKLYAHDSAYAYVKGRSIKNAVERHQTNKSNWFLKLDLTDFFGSIHQGSLSNKLSSLYQFKQMTTTVKSDYLRRISMIAYRNNKLPQGTPLSPILTNLYMTGFDYQVNQRLSSLGKQLQCRFTYTRYADDLLISSYDNFDYIKVIAAIQYIRQIGYFNLSINESKTRYGSKNGRNWNLGLMYNKDNKITVGHKRKKRLKVAIYNFFRDYHNNNTWPKEDLQVLQGQIAFVENIEPEYTNGLISFYETKYNKNIRVLLNTLLKD